MLATFDIATVPHDQKQATKVNVHMIQPNFHVKL